MQHDQQGQDVREWAPLAEVAVAMGISIDTIRRRMKRGEIETRREQTPQGFRWLAPLPDTIERKTSPAAPGSPQSDNSALHDLEIIQRERDELIETLRHELALRNRDISRLHEVIASQAAALQHQAPALAAQSGQPARVDSPPSDTIVPVPNTATPQVSIWGRVRKLLGGQA